MTAGDKIECLWGKWRVIATVTKVTKKGNVYAKRWVKKNDCWSASRRVEEYRGMWRVI